MEEQENELRRLNRQHRILVNDKHALKGAYGLKAKLQKKQILKMRQELQDLQLSLKMTQRPMEDCHLSAKLRSLAKCHNEYLSDINKTKDNVNEVQTQIKQLEKKMSKLRCNNKQNNSGKEEEVDTKELQRVENKLETAVKQYCTILSENRKLREDVMALLKDRQIFTDKFNKMLRTLATGKRHLMDTMDSAKTVYDQREEFLQKLNALYTKSKSIYTSHVEQMSEMKRQLDAQIELGRFLRTKGCSRIMADLERKEMQKRRDVSEAHQRQLENYEDMIQEIRKFVGEDDISRIATIFVRKENENFALFNYVNILNSEIETLTDEIMEQERKIELQHQIKKQEMLKQQQTFDQLQNVYASTKENADEVRKRHQDYEQTLSDIIQELSDLFNILDCSSSPMLQLLGETQEITMFNVLTHMEIFDGKLGAVVSKLRDREERLLRRLRERHARQPGGLRRSLTMTRRSLQLTDVDNIVDIMRHNETD